MPTDKTLEIKNISEEILNDFEENKLPFEAILLKIKKLARIQDDFDTIVWISLELMGYRNKNLIPNFPQNGQVEDFAKRSGRSVITKGEDGKPCEKYWTPSVSEIESTIINTKISLETIQSPQNYTPAVVQLSTGGSIVQENLRNVLDKIASQKRSYSNTIIEYSALLSKIRNMFYSYVLNVYYRVSFDSITETIFQQTKNIVDKKLQEIAPDTIKKLVAAYNRVNSNNDEELSQAMSSCRNALKGFADVVFPAQKEKFIRKDGSELDVSEAKYKNRLIAFIEEKEKRVNKDYLVARVNDLETRIHSLNDLLSKGTHIGLDVNFVNICIIDTYLVIGGMLDYFDKKKD